MRYRLIVISVLFAAGCAQEQPHLNVLLVTLDTTRADRIGKATPSITSIATSGVRFANADSPVPLTLPSHATILSGLLPLHHGLRNNGAGVFPPDRPTLATVFSANGYRTGAFVGSFVLDHRFGLNRGFEVYDDAVERDPAAGGDAGAERRASAVIDAALQWLGRADTRPYFAWVHLFDPHAPYQNGYDGEIAYMDAQLARLFQRIDRANTIIVIVGDHGESLGEHGEMQHGLLLYESTLHVPLIIAAPSLRPGAVEDRPVSTVDVAATIAVLSGTPIASNDGRDLFSETGRRDIYAETQYPLTFGWSELSSLRSRDKKLISGEIHELFDLDLGEKANLLQNDRRTFRDLATRLEAIRATSVKSAPSAVDEETKAKLASLGYVAPGAPVGDSRRDPRLMIDLFRQWERANEALSSNRAEEAARICERLVRDDPRNRVFRSTLAKALMQMGSTKRAVELYREAVALSPNDADAWYDLAAALQDSGNVTEAMKVIDEALRRDPNRAEGHNMRGVALADRDPAAALDEFRRAIVLDPRNARAYSNSGNALRALGRNQDAAEAYRRAIDLAPRYVDPLNGLGVLLVQEGRANEAIPLFDAALSIQPGFYEARLNRAIALDVSGNRAAALAELTALLSQLPRGEQSVRDSATHLLRQLRP